MKKILIVVCLLFSFQIYGQAGKDGNFTEKVFQSLFSDEDKSKWPLKNNQDYFFIIQNNRYVMECKGQDKKAYLLPKGAPRIAEFRIEASLTLDKNSDENGGAGLALDIQKELKGGYLFEINRKGEYRVSKLDINGEPQYLTGKIKDKGWTRFKAINKPQKQNNLSAVQNGATIRFYINNQLAYTVNNDQNLQGMNGFILIAQVKATASNFSMFAAPNAGGTVLNPTQQAAGDTSDDNMPAGNDLKKLTDAFLECRKKNKQLSAQYENYKLEVSQCKQKQEELQKFIQDNLDVKLRTNLDALRKENDKISAENEALREENEDLQDFKKTIQNSKEGDQVILYAEKYRAEQKKNEEMAKRVKQLEDELKKPKPTPKPKSKKTP